jgi:hypothetical protein
MRSTQISTLCGSVFARGNMTLSHPRVHRFLSLSAMRPGAGIATALSALGRLGNYTFYICYRSMNNFVSNSPLKFGASEINGI